MAGTLHSLDLLGHALDVLNNTGVAAKVELYIGINGAYTAKWSDHRSTLIAKQPTMLLAVEVLGRDVSREMQHREQQRNAGRF